MGAWTIKAAVEICVDLLRGMPLWAFWLMVIVASFFHHAAFTILYQLIFLCWAPAISYDLKSQYPGMDRHRSTRWFVFNIAVAAAVSIMAQIRPEMVAEPTIILVPLMILAACQFVAFGFLSGTIARLEEQAGIARPEEVGRNTFSAFLCLFYFPFGGLVLINRRLNALDSAIKSRASAPSTLMHVCNS